MPKTEQPKGNPKKLIGVGEKGCRRESGERFVSSLFGTWSIFDQQKEKKLTERKKLRKEVGKGHGN